MITAQMGHLVWILCILIVSTACAQSKSGHLSKSLLRSGIPNFFNSPQVFADDTSFRRLHQRRLSADKVETASTLNSEAHTDLGFIKLRYDAALPASTVPLDLYTDLLSDWKFACHKDGANVGIVLSMGATASTREGQDFLSMLDDGKLLVFGFRFLDSHPSFHIDSSCVKHFSIEEPAGRVLDVERLSGSSMLIVLLEKVNVMHAFSDLSWDFEWDPNRQPNTMQQPAVQHLPGTEALITKTKNSQQEEVTEGAMGVSRELQTLGATKCPVGWVYDAGADRCYKYHAAGASWNGARSACASYGYGASLASFDSLGSATAVVRNRCGGRDPALTDNYWIGGTNDPALENGASRANPTSKTSGWKWTSGYSTSYLFSTGGTSLWSSGWPQTNTCDFCFLACFGCEPAACIYSGRAGDMRTERCTNTMNYCCSMPTLRPSPSPSSSPAATATPTATVSATASPTASATPSASHTASMPLTATGTATVGTFASYTNSITPSAPSTPSESPSTTASMTPSTTALPSANPSTDPTIAPSLSATPSQLVHFCPPNWNPAVATGIYHCTLGYEVPTVIGIAEAMQQCRDLGGKEASVSRHAVVDDRTEVECLGFYPTEDVAIAISELSDEPVCAADLFIDDDLLKGFGFNYNFRTNKAVKRQLPIFDAKSITFAKGKLSGTGKVDVQCNDCYAFAKVGVKASIGFCVKAFAFQFGDCEGIGSGLFVRASASLLGSAGVSSNLQMATEGHVLANITIPKRKLVPTLTLPAISFPVAGVIPVTIRPHIDVYGRATIVATVFAQGNANVGFSALGSIFLAAHLVVGQGDTGSGPVKFENRVDFTRQSNPGKIAGFVNTTVDAQVEFIPTITIVLLGRFNVSHGFSNTKRFQFGKRFELPERQFRMLQTAGVSEYAVESGVGTESEVAGINGTPLTDFPWFIQKVEEDPAVNSAYLSSNVNLTQPMIVADSDIINSNVSVPLSVPAFCSACAGTVATPSDPTAPQHDIVVAEADSGVDIGKALLGPSSSASSGAESISPSDSVYYGLLAGTVAGAVLFLMLSLAATHDIVLQSARPWLFRAWGRAAQSKAALYAPPKEVEQVGWQVHTSPLQPHHSSGRNVQPVRAAGDSFRPVSSRNLRSPQRVEAPEVATFQQQKIRTRPVPQVAPPAAGRRMQLSLPRQPTVSLTRQQSIRANVQSASMSIT